MATTPTTPPVGSSAQQTLSDWAGGYVTDMLGRTQAVADQPYQVYQGPQTAGESSLQSKVFQGLGSISFPSNLGKSFSSTGAYSLPTMTGTGGPTAPSMPGAFMDYQTSPAAQVQRAAPTDADWNMFQQTAMFAPGTDMEKVKADFMSGAGKTGGAEIGATQASNLSAIRPNETGGLAPAAPAEQTGIAAQYMNPYLQSVLTPQLDELQRRSQMNLQPDLAKLTQAGGFGGSRQALMQGEAGRNLLQEQNKTVGQGYANAYDKAMQQFNTEQGQAKTLVDMLSGAGQTQRGIEQEGITADYNEFLAQRDYPQKMLQFQQSMLQGLPISTVSNQAASQSGIGQLSSTIGGLGNIIESLKKFGLAP